MILVAINATLNTVTWFEESAARSCIQKHWSGRSRLVLCTVVARIIASPLLA